MFGPESSLFLKNKTREEHPRSPDESAINTLRAKLVFATHGGLPADSFTRLVWILANPSSWIVRSALKLLIVALTPVSHDGSDDVGAGAGAGSGSGSSGAGGGEAELSRGSLNAGAARAGSGSGGARGGLFSCECDPLSALVDGWNVETPS